MRNPITCWLFAAETIAKINKGRAMPIPKKMKLNKLVTKLNVEVLTANSTANEPGLQGKTIAPKNKPKMNELK